MRRSCDAEKAEVASVVARSEIDAMVVKKYILYVPYLLQRDKC